MDEHLVLSVESLKGQAPEAIYYEDIMMDDKFRLMIDKFNAGRSILFTGAGFSLFNTNISNDNKLPLAKELAVKICKLGGFEESDDLSYAADRYIRDNENNDEKINTFIKILRNTFTIQSVSASVKNICSAPWHRFYTTNYDNSIEVAIDSVISIDMDSSVDKNELKDMRCVHLNGYIGNLKNNNINKSFKLSESSYISPNGFLNSAWYGVFKRDLERCSMLVFVGYSLYDLDIKRVLVEIPGLKNRTFFVVSDECSEKDKYIFSQYGIVMDIGAEKFGELISECSEIKSTSELEEKFYIQKYKLNAESCFINDKDIEDLLIFGKENKFLIEADAFSQKNDFVIFRNAVNTVANTISNSNIIITGDLGNGKSIFIKECLPILSSAYGDVYFIDDPYIDHIYEIEKICKQNDNIKIFVIENYYLYIDLLSYFAPFNTTKIRFILTSRSGKHEKIKGQLESINFLYKEICIDILKNGERLAISNLIDSVGFWGDTFITDTDKIKFIDKKCRGQFASLLLGLLDSKVIKDKVKKLIERLIEKDDDLKKATVTCLFVCMHDVKVDLSLLSTLAGNCIYDSNIINNESFREIFHTVRGDFDSISSIFCQKVIKDFVPSKYITQILLDISKKLDKRKKSMVEDTIFKSCFKFSTIERIISDDDKLKNIIDYYEKLKRALPWLSQDPHFWVQYAMGYIACGEYGKAQTFITNAYGKAKNKGNYHTNNIDTQQARLYFLVAIESEDISTAVEYFLKGHRKLANVPNDIYKFRQIYLYEKFFQKFYSNLTNEIRNLIKCRCNELVGNLLTKSQDCDSRNDVEKQKSIDLLKNISRQL